MTTQQQRSKEEAAWARIANGLSTASKWDEDPELLKTCRSQIPFSSLIDDDDGIFAPTRYCRPDDSKYEGDDLILKRLTLWFKMDFMTWVNSPPCSFCGCNENMVTLGTRGPITEEERDGEASRVEGMLCDVCLNLPH
jgi:peptide-N4-(N-acetyl-beta-glucosaminyl)asparagine amidase